MDRSADPCNDFYQFVCGSWVKNNPIPPDQGRWGRFSELAERNRLIAKDILEKASVNDPKRDAVHQKIGDFYQACMDENAVNQKGLKPLQPELDRIEAVSDRDSAIAELAHLHGLGVRGAVFAFSSGSDLHNADSVIAHVDQGGLGLPDRDDYLKDDANSKDKREKYLAHVTNMLKLSGDTQAEANAQRVMALETKLAQASMDRIERRKPENRGAEDRTKARRTNRVEQISPPNRPDDGHHHREDRRPDDQINASVFDLVRDCGEIRAAEEPREKGNRQKRDQRRANSHSRFREPTQYIRPPRRTDRHGCVRLRAFSHTGKMRASLGPR